MHVSLLELGVHLVQRMLKDRLLKCPFKFASFQLIAIVGFLICFSSIALLYGNLSNTAEEKEGLVTALEAQLELLKKGQ